MVSLSSLDKVPTMEDHQKRSFSIDTIGHLCQSEAVEQCLSPVASSGIIQGMSFCVHAHFSTEGRLCGSEHYIFGPNFALSIV